MHPLSRRTFLTTLAAALPAAAFVRSAHAAAIDDLASSPDTLRALGETVLPAELGRAGSAAAVADFQRWVANYRENAELLHGYGTSTLSRSGPTPATRWMIQLDALDATARRSGARSFDALPLDRRRAIVRAELDSVKADRLSPVGRAPHVALALLSHWYASADATDRCYDARILKESCRPLASSGRKPLPLAGVRA
ncbi:MAG: hypothetical protein JWN79_1286 [Gemmatimonadetes bacterium]|jgi:hypothetical protein|nr:hypothetical protein [Gemmatimonadota bacterium]